MYRLPWRFCAWFPLGERTAADNCVGEQTESSLDVLTVLALAAIAALVLKMIFF
jgi:hypothetical protein